MKAVLVHKRDECCVTTSCMGVDLAEIGSAPLSHAVGVKRNSLQNDALSCEIAHGGERITFEVIEGFGDRIVA